MVPETAVEGGPLELARRKVPRLAGMPVRDEEEEILDDKDTQDMNEFFRQSFSQPEEGESEPDEEVLADDDQGGSEEVPVPEPRGEDLASSSNEDEGGPVEVPRLLSWADAYSQSAYFAENWEATQSEETVWPEDIRIQGEYMIFQNLICVPEGKTLEVVRDYHLEGGHLGVVKMGKELRRRYFFPPTERVEDVAKAVKRQCVTCQAAEPPNFSTDLPIHFSPVPDQIMTSVSLDVFYFGPEKWQGGSFDSILLCVDRHSGWIIAKPCTKLGLTAEAAVHLMMDGGWETFGIPAVITSDQGAPFVGQFWKTWCARLGVRQAYSQAYRSQANGRAEVAGRCLINILRKLETDSHINWVEALPRVLRMYHDAPGETGLSPFEILFGRTRGLAGMPYSVPRTCEGAEVFMDRMKYVDALVAETLSSAHEKEKGAGQCPVGECRGCTGPMNGSGFSDPEGVRKNWTRIGSALAK